MQKTLQEIAQLVDGKARGDKDLVITGISGIKEAREGDITFLANNKYFSLLEKTQASAVIVPLDVAETKKNVIKVENPSVAFARLASEILEAQTYQPKGIHPTAIIAEDVVLGENVVVGPHTVIEKQAKIKDNTVIYSGCFVGAKTEIGAECLIYPNVVIRERISIGNRVIIHPGTVIGSDGFGFAKVDGVHQKIPQVGTVIIEDDVEIGSNVTIDRARFDKTFIGQGTKIDNLVQIAHNVVIGKHCLIISQSGISGSTTLEDRVILAGQVGIAGHLTIGENSVVAAKSGVPKSIPPNTVVFGYPAKPQGVALRLNAIIQRLPTYVKTIKELERKVKELQERSEK
ncbi:MAG: UDP-3-O-(3-hydroxymyristoyl)glucosamine N-acyltransferase [Candidatus Aceula meridiana]|nr:UDP-3-O-(3-hydroxymyristoyl)glucosamine N-acyltransferase [Candidatus Aceula meridiana]